MGLYLLKRLLYFIPTLVVISLLAFALSKMAPGDPVEMLTRGETNLQSGPFGEAALSNRIYRQMAANLGLDKPVFYFSLLPASYPDTLSRILMRDHRRSLRNLALQYGNWPGVEHYYHRLLAWEQQLYQLPDSLTTNEVVQMQKDTRRLYYQYKEASIRNILVSFEQNLGQSAELPLPLLEAKAEFQQAFEAIPEGGNSWKAYLPSLRWHGFDNQYHRWIRNFVRGNFGLSYYDKQPVANKMGDALRWTLWINGAAIFFSYLIALPLGVWAGARQGSRFDRASSTFLFILYSLPSFWIATLAVIFLTTPEYHLDWFPTMGVGKTTEGMSFLDVFCLRAQHFFLPVFCLTYGSLAFISRQMRGGMIDSLRKDYIRTARAKGLPEKVVVWKHAFRNALFPIITLLANVLPALLAGSVVIEVIFNIPGMGKLTIDAINRQDWPVVYTILMLAAIVTMIGILFADLLYAWADPRVRYRKSK